MRLSIATWNINSVRLRFDQVARFVADARPDVLCLQETKCPDDKFPKADLIALGFPHVVHAGQKGYNGVCVASRLPFETVETRRFRDREDARHIAVTFGPEAERLTVDNLYVPAGGDIPDPTLNPKFADKLAFLDDLIAWSDAKRRAGGRHVLVGDLNVAPLEHDVWSHKQLLDVVSHTPIETAKLLDAIGAGRWVDSARRLIPEPAKLYTWWSYRSPDWAAADKGRRLDHVWLSEELGPALTASRVHRDTRGWDRPSDHAPVLVTLDM